MTLAEALRAATARLSAAGVPDAAKDARMLLAHAAGLASDRLILHMGDTLANGDAFEAALTARLQRQPVSQIIGRRSFWGRDFHVTRDTLDPRPETETLIELALREPFRNLLDLGTGTGAICLTLMAETQAEGTATDISGAALAVAKGNAQRLGMHPRLILSDWFAQVDGRFDLIISNPPYIAESEMSGLSPEVREWEPHLALTPGGDGLSPYHALAAGAVRHLEPAGRILVEIGPTQGCAVSAIFAAAGLESPAVHTDMDGRDRVVSARQRCD